MNANQFVEKWRSSTLTERAASQSHFNDLCDLLGVEKPAEADPAGDWYCFERGASKTAGGNGWADAWKRGHFGWEYKGKQKNLVTAFAQLQQYAVALENPPLLVVSDMERIIIHTNWTNTVSECHVIELDDLLHESAREKLRWVFTDPERLRPTRTVDAITREIADNFANLAIALRQRGHDPAAVAHFVNRLVFCMFAEDVGLLPTRIFQQILEKAFAQPEAAGALLSQLFEAMRGGGYFGLEQIEWFNGGLFDDDSALPLTREDLKIIAEAAEQDWSEIDPSIFGTLFERGLDPAKRSQLGAHYTDPEKIMMIVRPVVWEPLWREWEQAKRVISNPRTSFKRKRTLLGGFLERLRSFRVLDPACGSGNFLYLALLSIKDLEHRVNLEAEAMGLGRQFPSVGPEVVQGIELNPYAAELARVTIWIGEIQWMRRNGFSLNRQPILRPLQHIVCCDAILTDDVREPSWPTVDVIIGNPPFLGGRKLKPELGDDYVTALRKVYAGRVPEGADLVCYWFEKAAAALKSGNAMRGGLVATNSISGGSNREVLTTLSSSSSLFEVWDDEPWTVNGAAVRVALICFQGGEALQMPRLNGKQVDHIYPDLTARRDGRGLDLAGATSLPQNRNLSFQGVVPRGEVNRSDKQALGLPDASFLVSGSEARRMISLPLNPNGRPNSDVVRPYLIGDEITNKPLDRYIIDFGEMTEREAALYEVPFEYIRPVKPHRAAMNQPQALQFWWRHWNTRPNMRRALSPLKRYIATPRVSKHRLFAWVPSHVLPDCQVVVIAREDDLMMGILQSRFHELWTLRMCTFLGVGNDPRYTPRTTFETFPFPGTVLSAVREPTTEIVAVETAARMLEKLCEAWLNPTAAENGEATQRRSRTALYNSRPTWLCDAHQALDEAVAHLYGVDPRLEDDDILEVLLNMNIEQTESSGTLL